VPGSTLALLLDIAAVALVAIATAALAWYTPAIVRLKWRSYRRGLIALLTAQRGRHYNNVGLQPRPLRLQQQVTAEADALIADWHDRLPEDASRGDLLRPIDFGAILASNEALADVRENERAELLEQLKAAIPAMERSWHRCVLALALVLSAATTLVIFPVFLSLRPQAAAQLGIDPAQPWSGLVHILSPTSTAGWSNLLVLTVAILAAALLAAAWIRRQVAAATEAAVAAAAAAPASEPPADEVDAASSDEEPVIGGPGRVVRALHLGSGGFDTIMHLGVAHALCVIQGRAPDVVVGISAGAIHAAAIAEVIQSSEDGERAFYDNEEARDFQELTREKGGKRAAELQHACLLARTHRLRTFIEAAQRSPERLIDALVPDAYQIDTGSTVPPLQQPRFSPLERTQREEQIGSRAGLTELYNDILNVPFSIGTVTRVVRGYLGLRAASDLSTRGLRRLIAQTLESLRLFLLVGLHLTEASRTLPIVLRPIKERQVKARLQNAGGLIFRSRTARRLRSYGGSIQSILYLLFLWSVGSVVAMVLYIAALTGAAIHAMGRPDIAMRSALIEGAKALPSFVLIAIFWISVALLVSLGVHIAIDAAVGSLVLGFERYLPVLGEKEFPIVELATPVAVIGSVLLIITLLRYREARNNPRSYLDRLLASYNIGRSILTEHGLRTFLVESFDANYYARARMDDIVEAALGRHQTSPLAPDGVKKTIGYYAEPDREAPIHLGLAVADTSTGRLSVVPASTSLIDGLLAAVAAVPFLPGKQLDDARASPGKSLFIDGASVSREPTRALLKLLRQRLHKDSRVVHIYTVTPFPISKPELGIQASSAGSVLNLIDVAWRAWRLQRFRDATLERRLTELFTRVIPPDRLFVEIDAISSRPGQETREKQKMYRAWMTPIELEQDADLNRRILGASKEHRRRVMYETIADGCRASMQVMLAREIEAKGSDSVDPTNSKGLKVRIAACSATNKHRLQHAHIPEELRDVRLPGSEPKYGPGLSEICMNCCLWRNTPNAKPQTLLLGAWRRPLGPSWPHERDMQAEAAMTDDAHFVRPPNEEKIEVLKAMQAAASSGSMTWPLQRDQALAPPADKNRPTISLLFSGGVFRGVYQMGVLAALDQLRLKPDIIAGASVGSITAAMIADAFSIKDDATRRMRIARLASIYLGIDRLILTDRLADFVRNLTLRAAETRFSIRQADRLFRKYDYPSLYEFDRNARRVVAGLERLFYLTPFQLAELVRAFRSKDTGAILDRLREAIQQYLDRMQVGDEALGADALKDLIVEYVTGGHPTVHPAGFTIDELRQRSGIQFLATATELTEGKLTIFGEQPHTDVRRSIVLKEALLASSAFPGVFRPRWSWEPDASNSKPNQYIDGGVMDNLPIDAVTQFLARVAEVGLTPHAPHQAPHLIVAASLEVSARTYFLSFTRRQFEQSWRLLRKRATQLGYNRKLHTFADAQDRLIKVKEALPAQDRNYKTVDIRVIGVQPEWLCGTFAFHPMLGFTRTAQAKSIAHGCASTLLRFARFNNAHEDGVSNLDAWGIDRSWLPAQEHWIDAFEAWERKPHGPDAADKCWLSGQLCPFSKGALQRLQPATGERLTKLHIEELSSIHTLCRERGTHLRRI
jgi:predicted acylesterase/phospholipase RssA